MKRLLLIAAAVALCAPPFAPAPAAAFERPASASQAQSPPFVVPMQGASNFRDLGGYRTADGRRVRRGRVYRSASTDELTLADAAALKRLGVQVICDLRDARERRPNRPHGMTLPPIVTWPDEAPYDLSLTDPKAAERLMREGYARMPVEYGPQTADILRRIARGETPLLFNCSGGKDRTGFVSALLLRTLGVPYETVLADYLASNRLYKPRMGRTAPPKASPEALAVLAGVREEWLAAAFATIDSRFGSLERYLQAGLGLTPAEIAAIRRQMLEPGRS